jgi:hypothetical protein
MAEWEVGKWGDHLVRVAGGDGEIDILTAVNGR